MFWNHSKKTRRWIREHTNLPPISYEFVWEEALLLNADFNRWLQKFVQEYTPIIKKNNSLEMKSSERCYNEETKKYTTHVEEWTLEGKDLIGILCFEVIYRNLKPLVRIPRWVDEINVSEMTVS
jgi:hypothetical protein